ncbi:hypothetical protein BQ8482_360040 [Mesorhizobium delmotii]|uniref:Uncharacterized protein n=1 Tax=Mesorhizobium delmotii TaxID=1631247 RepID=A0A2P9AR68_9HYPH|nr:hypothetical protein BQ8482_360040 [Mesorhizobium delmotii]
MWGEKLRWASLARSKEMISAMFLPKINQLYASSGGACPKLGSALRSCIELINTLIEDEGTIGYEA